jgi:hypothetical protein
LNKLALVSMKLVIWILAGNQLRLQKVYHKSWMYHTMASVFRSGLESCRLWLGLIYQILHHQCETFLGLWAIHLEHIFVPCFGQYHMLHKHQVTVESWHTIIGTELLAILLQTRLCCSLEVKDLTTNPVFLNRIWVYCNYKLCEWVNSYSEYYWSGTIYDYFCWQYKGNSFEQ